MIVIGYFGVPGTIGGKVHICGTANINDLHPAPLCGARLGAKVEFQWCATWPNGFTYIECEHCKKKAKKMVDEWLKQNEPKRRLRR